MVIARIKKNVKGLLSFILSYFPHLNHFLRTRLHDRRKHSISAKQLKKLFQMQKEPTLLKGKYFYVCYQQAKTKIYAFLKKSCSKILSFFPRLNNVLRTHIYLSKRTVKINQQQFNTQSAEQLSQLYQPYFKKHRTK